MSRFFLSLCFILGALASLAYERVAMDPAIITGTLPNGMTYYVQDNPRKSSVASVYLMLNIGSVVEEENQRGMAHFVEHMAFEGTKHYPVSSLVETLGQMGLEFGSDINAATSADNTVFRFSNIYCLDSIGERNLETALAMMRDIASGITFGNNEIEKERSIIIEEHRQSRSAGTRLHTPTAAVLFGKESPYLKTPIGTLSALQSMTQKDLKDFYEKWYQPQHMAIAVVGNIDTEKVVSQIKSIMGKIKKLKHPSTRQWAQVPDNTSMQGIVLTDPELTGAQIDLWFKSSLPPRSERDNLDYYKESLAFYFIEKILDSRLSTELYKENAVFSGAGADYSQCFGADSKDALRIHALYNMANRHDALATLILHAKSAAELGFNSDEIDTMRDRMRNIAAKMPAEAKEKYNYQLYSRISEHFLKGNPPISPYAASRMMMEFADTVTQGYLNSLLRKLIAPERLTVILEERETFDPARPSTAALLDSVKSIWASVKPDPFLPDSALKKPLLENIPPRTSPVKTVEDSIFLASTFTYPNGANVTIIKNQTNAHRVLLRAVRRGGHSALLGLGHDVEGYHAAEIANLGGLGAFSKNQLKQKFKDTNISLAASQTAYADKIEGSADLKDLETLLQMLYLRMTSVRADSAVFENWRKACIGIMHDIEHHPEAVFGDSVTAITYGANNPYRPIFKPEDFENIDCALALELYHSRITNPANWDYIISGNFEIDDVEPLAAKYIGTLPGQRTQPQPFQPMERRALEQHKHVRFSLKMAEPVTNVHASFSIRRPYTLEDEMALKVVAEMMNKLCQQRLREESAGTYSVSVSSVSSEIDGEHTLNIDFDTNAEMADTLLSAAKLALFDIARSKYDVAVYSEVLNALALAEQSYAQMEGYPVSYFTHVHLYGNDDVAKRYEALLTASPEKVAAIARAMANSSSQVTIIMDGE